MGDPGSAATPTICPIPTRRDLRDAHLPQTGQLNSATENALNNMLAGGNNQMGGNTNNNVMNN